MSGVVEVVRIGITGNLQIGAWHVGIATRAGSGGQRSRADLGARVVMVARRPFLCMMLSWGNRLWSGRPLMVLLAAAKAPCRESGQPSTSSARAEAVFSTSRSSSSRARVFLRMLGKMMEQRVRPPAARGPRRQSAGAAYQ